MSELPGLLLPLAAGMALSPVPVATVIIVLLSTSTPRPGVGFLLGWVSGTALGLTAFTALASAVPRPPGPSAGVSDVVELVIGAALIALGLGQWWFRRRRSGPSRWWAAATSLTASRAFAVGLALATASPKTVTVGLAAGLALGSAPAEPLVLLAAGTAYTLLAVSTIALPVAARLILKNRITRQLEVLQRWLGRHDHLLVAAVLGLVGVTLLLRGL